MVKHSGGSIILEDEVLNTEEETWYFYSFLAVFQDINLPLRTPKLKFKPAVTVGELETDFILNLVFQKK